MERGAGTDGAPAAPQCVETHQGKLLHVREQNPFVPAWLPLAGHRWEGDQARLWEIPKCLLRREVSATPLVPGIRQSQK